MISIVEVYSASSTLSYKGGNYWAPLFKHVGMLVIGFFAMIFVMNTKCRYFKIATLPVLSVSFFFLIVVWLTGGVTNGASRWIDIMGIQFQPSELGKGALVLAVAQILSAMQTETGAAKKAFKYILFLSALIIIPISFENLSTALLAALTVLLMMFVGRVPLKQIGKLLGVFALLIVFALVLVMAVGTDKEDNPPKQNLTEQTVDTEELMQEAESGLFELSQKNMRQDYTQIDPVIRQAIDILTKASADSSGLTGITSGFTKLDDITSGWQKSDLVIIAGRPAMGKTSFALSIAKNIAVDYKIPVAFFSLEMNNVQLVDRLISNVCEIEGKKIMNGQLARDEWERLDKNLSRLTGAPLFVDDTPGMSIFELRTKARRLVREKGVKVIMIDYLQLMNANGARFGNRQEEVSTISRSLKGLAKELDIPMIALSQLNRTVEGREGLEGKRPQLSDLRESGAIEQDADMVLFVHRPEYYHLYEDEKGNDLRGKAQIIIAKHRKGATGDVLLAFQGQYTRFSNPEDAMLAPLPNDLGGGEIISSRLGQGDDDPLGGSDINVPF